jgi:D-amino peptidase
MAEGREEGFVVVSVDAEGLPSPSLPGLMPGWSLYQETRRIMTRLVAAVAGRLQEHGRWARVADSHGFMVNIDPLELHGDVELVRGFPRLLSMVAGARGALYAVFLGYHTAASTDSVMSHSFSGSVVHRLLVNGEPASEYLVNSLLLGEWGVPVAVVAGAEELRGEVEKHTPWAVFVPLTRSLGYVASLSRSIDWAEAELAAAVDEAEKRLRRGLLHPLRPPSRVEVCVETHRPLYAEAASLIPGARRRDAVTTCYAAGSMEEAYRALEAMVYLGAWASRVMRDQMR